MKKLICAKEVEALEKQGQKVMYIDADTLITPSARDAAAACGITFSEEAPPAACCSETANTGETAAPTGQNGIDSDMIYKALTALMEKGELGGVLQQLGCEQPYLAEKDPDGLVKLVRGSTAKWEVLDTGNPADKVFYNELIGADDGSSMNAGFMTIEKCKFPWDVACEEIYYVVEGTLTVEKDGRVFTAHPGDALFFQNGAKLTFGSPDKVKVFYATH